jgi:hypothetical protein
MLYEMTATNWTLRVRALWTGDFSLPLRAKLHSSTPSLLSKSHRGLFHAGYLGLEPGGLTEINDV